MKTFLRVSKGTRLNPTQVLFLLAAAFAMVITTSFGLLTYVQPASALAPTFFSVMIKAKTGGNTIVAVIFSEGVSGTSGGSTALNAADFTIGGTDSMVINTVLHTAGSDVAILYFTSPVDIVGAGEFTIDCAATSIYDNNATNACVSSPQDVNNATLDTTPPNVAATYSCDTDADGDIDRIQINFSERMNDDTINNNSFEADNDTTNNSTGEEFGIKNTATGGCDGFADDTDVNDNKIRIDLATGITGTEAAYIHAPSTIPKDLVGNAIVTGQAVGSENDKASPVILSWNLDMVSNQMDITFSESVDVSTLTPTGITIQDAATATTSRVLTGGATPSLDGSNIIVSILTADADNIVANASLATSTANTYLVVGGVISDLSGDAFQNVLIANGSGLQASSVLTSENSGRGIHPCVIDPTLCNLAPAPSPEPAPVDQLVDPTPELILEPAPETLPEDQLMEIDQEAIPELISEEVEKVDLENKAIGLGSLITVEDTDAVYYLDNNGVRHVFVSYQLFESWYEDFLEVVEVSPKVIAALPLGAPVTFKPGTMIKVPTLAKVYLVMANQTLAHIDSEQVAQDLFGDNWNQMIFDIDDSLLFSYTFGNPIMSGGEVNLNDFEDQALTVNSELVS